MTSHSQPASRWSHTATAEAAAASAARRRLQGWALDLGVHRTLVDDIALGAYEALANVVEHAYGPGGGNISVQLRIERPDIVAVIGDTGRWREPRGRDAGRGIILMHALTDDVQIERTQTGTRVLIRRTIAEGRSR